MLERWLGRLNALWRDHPSPGPLAAALAAVGWEALEHLRETAAWAVRGLRRLAQTCQTTVWPLAMARGHTVV